ncbi:hypothetical protein HAX54_000055 [Datura stramonium]|uniref:Cupin type-1 domain-containing protein n=1 Tax=Datura stramonium TaxID=4076 RepID=A0ABS8RFS9_DATST|nr:hypothetical protein [Datura stramonium]
MRGEESREGESQYRTGGDRHQKVRQFRQGDVLALPAGITLWLYNHGQDRLVTVALLDVSNPANQLDLKFRGREDPRGQIIRAERLDVLIPEFEEAEEEQTHMMPRKDFPGRRGSQPNGLEQTFCTMRFRENLGRPSRADVYNPRGGRISTLNSHRLPILNWLQLSAEKGVLYQASHILIHVFSKCNNGTILEHERPQHHLHHPRYRPDSGGRGWWKLLLQRRGQGRTDDRRATELRRGEKSRRPRTRIHRLQDQRSSHDQPVSLAVIGNPGHAGGSSDELISDFQARSKELEV